MIIKSKLKIFNKVKQFNIISNDEENKLEHLIKLLNLVCNAY